MSAFLDQFISREELCSDRWRISRKTALRLEEKGLLTPVSLPGKAGSVHYRRHQIEQLEAQYRGDVPTQKETIMDSATRAKRDRQVWEQFEVLTSPVDGCVPILRQSLEQKLASDAKFTAADVESWLAGRQQEITAIKQIVEAEARGEAMAEAAILAKHNPEHPSDAAAAGVCAALGGRKSR